MIDQREKRLQEISNELHDIANSYAGDETGIVAVRLHGASGQISDCLRMLESGINSSDKLSVIQDWLSKQPSAIFDDQSHKDELARILAKSL